MFFDSKDRPTCFPLSAEQIERYVSASNGNNAVPNAVPNFVDKVVISIRHPLLEHITLVDTPGLGDPDGKRAEVTSRALQSLDGWIFLLKTDKANEHVLRDLKRLSVDRSQSQMARLLAFSMVNNLVVPTGMGIDRALAERRATYAEYTDSNHPTLGFNALGVALARPGDESH